MERLIRSAVCTRCGCACDDVDLTVARGRVAEARNVCALGRPWFLTPLEEDGAAALVDGIAVTAEEGAAAAASLLAGAGRPLIWGLIHLSCEAQRLAVELAERVGAAIDPAAGPNHPAAVSAFQEWGEVSATLGEVAEQRGLVVLWLADPERTHPRLLERWRIGEGDGDRLIRFGHGVPVDGSWTVPPGREVEFLWTLRELARRRAAAGTAVVSAATAAVAGGGQAGAVAGPASTGPSVEAKTPTEDGGDLQPLARRLLERLATAPYVAFAFEAEAMEPTQQHALRALAATLNGITRFRLFPLRGAGNRVGAEAVLTWQTGFPVAVDFGSGAPRANAGELSAARLLARGEVDAALVACANPVEFAAEPDLGRLAELPLALLDSAPNPLAARARVVLRSAPYGLASGGTFFRMDGVALTLRPALSSRYPTEQEWLARILSHLPTANSQ